MLKLIVDTMNTLHPVAVAFRLRFISADSSDFKSDKSDLLNIT